MDPEQTTMQGQGPNGALAQELEDLRRENLQLRAELEARKAPGKAAGAAKKAVFGGGWRLLIPLFDRQKVVRSFAKMAETASRFTGPQSSWPTRDELLGDARTFMESVVRFQIRRRTLVFFLSALAGIVPGFQLWLVVQQNEIIENQNEYFEIQVYDIVARSMTEGDTNARLMTGALLANARLEFLEKMIDETFDPSLVGVYTSEEVGATRRLEDAAFRGNLVRAVTRAIHRRGPQGELSADDLFESTRGMIRAILVDAADRVPQVLRIGGSGANAELTEQVNHYIAQIGGLLRMYGRVARSAGELDAYYDDIGPLLRRLSERAPPAAGHRFGLAYQSVIQDLLFEQALEPELGDGPLDLGEREPTATMQAGLARLQEHVDTEGVRWARLGTQAGL